MTELSFAKSFLTTLDSRPSKLSSDHIEDPKSYPARGAYILPKLPKPLPRRTTTTTNTPGTSSTTITITLKSLRNPPIDLLLPSQPLNTSIHSLKTTLAEKTSIPVTKIKLLFNKKPVPDSKILKDFLSVDGEGKGKGDLEFSVMVIGGAAALKGGKEEEREVLPDEEGLNQGQRVLSTDAFWSDLRAFLVQRLKDEREGERVVGVFRRAVDAER